MSGPDTQTLPNVPIIHRPGDQAVGLLKRSPLEVRKRLMIVDDELPILKLVTRILATDNYEISGAQSGEAAADLIAAADFPGLDLLVTDLIMPGMNGRQLGVLVRQKYPKVRILYVTGFADTLFKDLQELGEGESFIEKPFGTDGLRGDAVVDVRPHCRRGSAARSTRECGRVGRRSAARESCPPVAPAADGLGKPDELDADQFECA